MQRILTSKPDLCGLDGALYDQVRAAFSKLADRRPTAHDILQNLISSGVPATVAEVLRYQRGRSKKPSPGTGAPLTPTRSWV